MCYNQKKRGRVAQWIEQQIPVLWVGGSNPSALVIFTTIRAMRSVNAFSFLQETAPTAIALKAECLVKVKSNFVLFARLRNVAIN